MRGTAGALASVGTGARAAGTVFKWDALKQWGENYARNWSRLADETPPSTAATEEGNLFTNPAMVLNPMWWSASVGETVPSVAASMVPGGGAYKAIRVGGRVLPFTAPTILKMARWGAAITGGAIGGHLEGASTFDYVKQRGGTDEEAVKAMALMGLVAGFLNSVSFGQMLRIPQAKKQVGRIARASLAEMFTEWAEGPSQAIIVGDDVLKAAADETVVAPVAALMGAAGAGAAGAAMRGAPSQKEDTAAIEQVETELDVVEAPTPVPGAVTKEDVRGMSPAQLRQVADAEKQHEADTLEQALGSEDAKKFDRLNRKEKPTSSEQIWLDDIEERIQADPELKRLVYGVGEKGLNAEELNDLATRAEEYQEFTEISEDAPVTQRELRVNPKYLDPTEGLREVIVAVNASNAELMAESRKRRRMSDVERAAAENPMTIEEMRILPDRQPLTDVDTVRLGDLENALALEIVNLTKARMANPADHHIARKRRQAFALTREVDRKREATSAEWGRTGVAHKIVRSAQRAKLDPKAMAAVDETLGVEADQPLPVSEEALDTMVMTVPATRRQKFITKLGNALQIGGEAAYGIWLDYFLLTGPQTQMVSIGSNILQINRAIAERAVGEVAGRVRRGLTGGTMGIAPGEVQAMIYSLQEGTRVGLKWVNHVGKTGQDPTRTKRFELQLREREGMEEHKAPIEWSDDFRTRFAQTLLYGFRLAGSPSRALQTGDAFFKGLMYNMEIAALSVRQATRENHETDKAYRKRVAYLRQNPTKQMQQEGMNFAQYLTLQENLGPYSEKLAWIIRHIPVLKILVPFFRVGVNAGKQAVGMTPGLQAIPKISPHMMDDLNSNDPAAHDRAMARVAMGAMTGAFIAAMAMPRGEDEGKEGEKRRKQYPVITGYGPRDKNLRQLMMEDGWAPYSVLVGDTYHSYNRLDPVGMQLGIIADFTNEAAQMPEHKFHQMLMLAVESCGRTFMSKTYLEGLSNLTAMIEDPTHSGKYVVEGLARSLVPTLIRTVKRTGIPGVVEPDPYLRDARSFMDIILASTPWTSDMVEAKRGLTGAPVELEGGLGIDLFSPVYKSTLKTEPIINEIARLGMSIARAPMWIGGHRPPQFRRRPAKLGEGLELLPEEYAYFVQRAAFISKDGEGMTMIERLRDMIDNDPDYAEMKDGPEGGKAMMIRQVIESFREQAKEETIAHFPRLQLFLGEQARRKEEAWTPDWLETPEQAVRISPTR